MSGDAWRFGGFRLDVADRRLSRDGVAIDLPSRYLDALILLVEARGTLVSKERFMAEVWRGVPVTDEALTQAIRTLRRALGDDAAAPRFIETVPKHGYRFVAPVERVDPSLLPDRSGSRFGRVAFIRETTAGASGTFGAGALIGLLYGLFGVASSAAGGALSLLLVIVVVCAVSAGAAGAGIAVGIAASRLIRPARWYWTVSGGALGGIALGALASMIGRDAFRLLFGGVVGPFTGAMEGCVVGAAAGLATLLQARRVPRATVLAAALGAAAGLVVILLHGRLMAGSLEVLIAAFPAAQFRLAEFGQPINDGGLGAATRWVTAAAEGAIFMLGLTVARPAQQPQP